MPSPAALHRNPASRWFVRILGSAILLGLLVGVVALVGSLLDPEYETEWTARVPVPPSEVLDALADPQAVGVWWRVDGVSSGRTDAGEPAWIVRDGGEGVRLRVERREGGLTLTVAEERVDYRYTREVDVSATDGGSLVTVREQGTTESKLARALDRAYRGPGHRARDFLRDLSRHLGGAPPEK